MFPGVYPCGLFSDSGYGCGVSSDVVVEGMRFSYDVQKSGSVAVMYFVRSRMMDGGVWLDIASSIGS